MLVASNVITALGWNDAFIIGTGGAGSKSKYN